MNRFIIGSVFFLLATIVNAAEPSWIADWNVPKAEHRPLQIIHGWFGTLEKPDGVEFYRDRCGLGGFVCNVSGKNYLRDDAEWTRLVNGVKKAREAGLRIWIYDEDGYPSLGAGGVVLDGHRELESLALVYDPTAAEPFAVRPAYEYTHASNNYAAARRYPNPLDAAATKRFIDVTHEQYRKHLGDELFGQIEAFFTDEPSLIAINIGQIPEENRVKVKTVDPLDPSLKLLPMIPWVADLPERYKAKYGEDLLTQRKSLFTGDTPEDRKIRQRFWCLIGELDKERYYGLIQDWCHRAGASVPTPEQPNVPLRLASSGHGLHEENLLAHVPLDGNKLQALARMDLPGLDELNSDPMVPFYGGWKTAGFPCSAASMIGKRLVMTEISDHSQKNSGDKKPVGLAWMQAAAAWQAAWGVTEFTLYYRIEDRGEENHKKYCEFVGRLNAVLRNAKPIRPVLLYYPIENLQEAYLPTAEPFTMKTQSEDARKTVQSMERLGNHLTRTQVPFTIIDSIFLEKAALKGNELEIAGNRFHTLLLPDVELPKNVAAKVETLRNAGVRVLVDPKDSIVIPNAPTLDPKGLNIVLGRFERDGADIFLLTNADKDNPYEGRLRGVSANGTCWNPATGAQTPVEIVDGSPMIRLQPLQTLLIVLTK